MSVAADLPALWRLTAAQLAEGYRAGAFTPVEATRACLQRIEEAEPTIHAMVHIDHSGALAAAEASTARMRAGAPLGALDGIPLTVKDNLHVAGMPTRWGVLATSPLARTQDELPVRRAREAGAVFLGKTNLPPFALQGYTQSDIGGLTRNPRDLSLSPGGSSGGAAAAVAAGYGPLAIATDGGGSIRRPAGYCGVIGYKPSEGLIARSGGLPDLFDGRECVGGFARTVPDMALLIELLAGRPLGAPAPHGPARVLFVPSMGARPVDSSIVETVRTAARAMERRGDTVQECASTEWAERVHASWPRLSAAGLAWMLDRADRWPDVFDPGCAKDIAARGGEATLTLWHAGRDMGATELVELADAVAEMRRTLGSLFSEFDFILTPATSSMAWAAVEPWPQRIGGQPAGPRSDAVFTPFVNAAGLCAISLPCGAVDGLPTSCQIVAPCGQDVALLDFALRAASFAHGLPLAEIGSPLPCAP